MRQQKTQKKAAVDDGKQDWTNHKSLLKDRSFSVTAKIEGGIDHPKKSEKLLTELLFTEYKQQEIYSKHIGHPIILVGGE